jgi:hypothetical protein
VQLRYALIVFAAACSSRPPDFKALCEKVAACEGKSAARCVEDRRHLWEEQKERGCGDEGAALVTCEIKYGRCERGGNLVLYMPTDSCMPELQRFDECLRESR